MRKALCLFISVISCLSLPAAIYRATDCGANGADALSDREAFQTVLNKAAGSSTEIELRVPAGTYYLDRALFIFSNTKIVLEDGAVIARMSSATDKVMLIGRHCNADGSYCTGGVTCRHGGHTQLQNVHISGGTWNAMCDGSDYVGIFHLCHGDHISVDGVTILRAGDHAMNFSGSSNVSVIRCTFADAVGYTGTDKDYWGEYEVGDENRYNTTESIHLDITNASGEKGNYPEDSTTCDNVTVQDCVFSNVFSGVGNHHADTAHKDKNLNVLNCRFSGLRSYALYLLGFSGAKILGNAVSRGAGLMRSSYADLTASGNSIVDSSEHPFFLVESAVAELTRNAITNCTGHGIYAVEAQVLAYENAIFRAAGCGIRAKDSVIDLRSNKVQRVTVAESYGISASDCRDCVVIGNVIDDIAASGIVLEGGSAVCSGNKIAKTGDCGIRAVGDAELTMSNNVITNTVSHGVSISGGKLTLIGNEITSAGGHGCVAAGTTLIVRDNEFVKPTKSGLWLTSCNRAVLSGNVVVDAGDRGIYVGTSTECELSANRIEGTKSEGIYAHKSSSCSVVDNVIVEARGIGVRVEGDATVSSDNATVARNDATSVGTGTADIRICGYAANSVVSDNVCGGSVGTTFEINSLSSAKYHPADARDVQVTRKSLDAATVCWRAMTGVTGYIVECSKTADFSSSVRVEITDPTATSATIAGLSSSVSWYVRVRSWHQYYGTRYESTGATQNTVYHLYDEYNVSFWGGPEAEGLMSAMTCKIGRVYALTSNAFSRTGMKFTGWQGSDGRIYDDGVLIFDLSKTPGAEIRMTAIWEAE